MVDNMPNKTNIGDLLYRFAMGGDYLQEQEKIKNEQTYRKWQMEQQQTENQMAMMKQGYLPSNQPTSQVPPGMYTEMGGQGYRYTPQITQQQMMAQMAPYLAISGQGNLLFEGMTGKSPRFVSKQALDYKQKEELETAQEKNKLPTADMKNMLKSTQQAYSLVDNLDKQAQKLKGGYAGIGEIMKGAVNRGSGKSADYRLYLSQLPAAAVSIYRGVTGDTRLSDADAQARAYPILWHPSEHIDTRKKKNDFVKYMIKGREILLKKGDFQTDPETGSAITDWSTVNDLARKMSLARGKGYSDAEIEKFLGVKNAK